MKSFIMSFYYAFKGFKHIIPSERNFIIHCCAAVLVILLGLYFEINRGEWIMIIIVSGLVLVSEMINTGIEKLVDMVEPERNEKVGIIKDISAGAVLISSIVAAIVGLMIFLPYF